MTEQKKEYQHTIAKEVSYSGIGLHSGKDVLMTLQHLIQVLSSSVPIYRTDRKLKPYRKMSAPQ